MRVLVACEYSGRVRRAFAPLGTVKPGKTKALPDQMATWVTTNEAAAHFGRHHGPVHIHLCALEGNGLVRRVKRDGQLAWTAAL